MIPGRYTLYDLEKLPQDAAADCQMTESTQINPHEQVTSVSRFTTVDLCSGLGGFAIGSHHAGMATGLFIEKSDLACQALECNFAAPVIQGDVGDVQVIKQAHMFRPHGPIQVTAGFPANHSPCKVMRKDSRTHVGTL